ncbi:MAG: BatA domain-containing protein [Pirellulaceae bacterium]
MFFANSLLLAMGGLLVAVPVVLHFLMQPKRKTITFPAIRFVQRQEQSNRRQLAVRHWLLLALRALVILLVAMALAGPTVAQGDFSRWASAAGFGFVTLVAGALLALTFFRAQANKALTRILAIVTVAGLLITAFLGFRAYTASDTTQLGNNADPVAAILIVDNSPRMDYVRENKNNRERAREMGNWVLGQLPIGSRVAVMSLRDDEPFFSFDIAAAQNRLDSLETEYQPIPIPRILERAFDFLEEAPEDRHEVYVVSDMTAESWASGGDKTLSDILNEENPPALFAIDVGSSSVVNLSIDEIKLDSNRLTENSILGLTATLSSTSSEANRTLLLQVEKPDPSLPVIQDGETLVPDEFWQFSESVAIPAESTTTIHMKLGQALPIGVHHGSVSIVGGDGLAVDDQRFFSVEVSQQWQVLVVSPKDVSPTNLTSILDPGILGQANSSAFHVSQTTPSELNREPLEQYVALFLLDPGPMDEETWSQLERFVFGGGSLAIFLGSNAATKGNIDTSFNTPIANKLLGGTVDDLWTQVDGNVSLSPSDLSHPIFKSLRAQENSLAWFQFPVFYHWGFTPVATEESTPQVLLRYNNREPAIIENRFGTGHVLTMTTPISERALSGQLNRKPFGTQRDPWNQLFAGTPVPAWLLMREIVHYLTQLQSDTLNGNVGQFVHLRNSLSEFPETYALFSPDRKRGPTRVNATEQQVVYKFTDLPGTYRLKGSRNEQPVNRGFSVNLPSHVTKLNRITQQELDELLGKGKYQIAQNEIEIERQQGTSRQGQEFYPLVVLMMCIIFGLEYLLGNRFYAS